MNAGHKSDGDWKQEAYQAVVRELNATWQLGLTKLNVKNILKAWKKHYAIITDIRSQSGLVWDDEKKMVPITVENLAIWNAYVEV
jgi:hemoglobin-like flavoprotein